MSLDDWVYSTNDTVDAEVRAHVYSLVTAVGGTSAELDGRYVLGDDALACLKDLKRWLSLYDTRLKRLDVARCIAEANLVKGDLLEILALWHEADSDTSLRAKTASSCLELLVPLTWPIEIEDIEFKVNHHRHMPFLQLAQAGYKRDILQHESNILRTIVRVGLPAMAVPMRERNPREEGIIRLVLYFLRNIAVIAPPRDTPMDTDEAEISRSATIDTFHSQDIFQLLLTVSSSMGDEFSTQDVIILEILFHLLKGVDVEKLFMEEQTLAHENTNEFKALLQKEKAMLAGYARHAPTRHNRFGTMIWVKRDDDKVSTVSGQDVLGKAQQSILHMDKSKKWNKPRRGTKKTDERVQNEFDTQTRLTSSARKHLRRFVEEFLDSAFNPLFMHVRKAIERETDRVLKIHSRQYFYLISWFLQAEVARRKREKAKAAAAGKKSTPSASEDESFALIASVMDQETFILLNRYMQRSEDEKQWQDLNACMKCFTQILLMVQEMSDSLGEDDQEIAENIQNRIFYEETTHDRIVTILRNYKDQGLGYLDACTELSHVFVRMLERYSKQNVDLQVRSKRRARRKRKARAEVEGDLDAVQDQVSDGEDIREAQRTATERKFDFTRFAARFTTQSCINTFVSFTKFYNDLSLEQLKRCHRFFYRVAFKLESSMLLFRVDILHLFNKMIKGPENLDPELPIFKEWEELVKQIFKRAIKKIQERPELVVEMLFSKIPTTMYYLEHGYEREIVKRAPRAPAELEVKPGMEKADQIGVAVSILVDQTKMDAIKWVKDVLQSATSEREAWEAENQARATANQETSGSTEGENSNDQGLKAPSIVVKPDNDQRRIAMFKDNKLRLLMKLVGFERMGLDDDIEATWIIPSDLSSETLNENLNLVRKFEAELPTYEDGKSAEDFVRSKAAAARKRAEYDDDSDGIVSDGDGDGELLFEPGGPTKRKSDALEELKKRRRKRNRHGEEPDDEEKAKRAEMRRERERENLEKIKSAKFIHDSDDESDEERDRAFFAREELLRLKTGRLASGRPVKESGPKKRKADVEGNKRKKRRKSVDSDDEEGSDGNSDDVVNISSDSSSSEEDNVNVDSEEETVDTPLSSQQPVATPAVDEDEPLKEPPTKTRAASEDTEMVDVDEDDEDDDIPMRKDRRRNVRAGFVVNESDSE
ncbi:timeless protein [Patellaria atrata CBS 101060]|uniref:Topoisomerase 1-associated factor 1 n=1 Tax=Patellaria atrata CBS 101060 TaxID=1346257 RepID=A0A9P4S2A9_9PEZI|nr:timeless protein [Patellaria atrata CBS 101060]